MSPRKHRPLAEVRAFSKKMWRFIFTTLALYFLWMKITTPAQQPSHKSFGTENAHKQQEQSPSVDKNPARAICELSKAMNEHADFFSALGLDPLSNEFDSIRMGVYQHHKDKGVEAIRRAYEDLEERKAEVNLDVLAAAFALLDEDSLRIFLDWVEEKPGASGWTVDWEKHCGAELNK